MTEILTFPGLLAAYVVTAVFIVVLIWRNDPPDDPSSYA